ncbi:MAG TPA: sialidase family protein [Longimicrobiales bacterium]|nr:sialidase family protein [Longimicrobiales bacterium]
MNAALLSVLLLALASGCAPGTTVEALASPAGEGSGEPYLSSAGDGVVMSWLQRGDAGGHDLWTARLTATGWTSPRRVAHRDDFFVNWADFPSVVWGGDGALWAHWLERRPAPGLAYDIRVVRSLDDGLTWSPPWTPHEDGTATEHGFVTLFPTGDGVGMTWLDGRKYAHGVDGAPPTREMTLRSRRAPGEGEPGPELLVDDRTCDCCQTDVAVTSEGPVVVYRNRTEEEVRDIFVARWTGDAWSEGTPVHDDGWVIGGCPVNGPAVDARGMDVAVAWFTGADDVPKVMVAFSRDGGATFGPPVRVDGGDPAGRVDLRLLAEGAAAVAWLERVGGDRAELRVTRVGADGSTGRAAVVAESSAARASGFPRMAALPWAPGQVMLAWTDVSEIDRSRIAVARVEVGS